ncbi:magnesium/cobalt transporter CorA [Taibaiella sp. KBW10]|uniref:magnesium/cobalt transporter CorA n=1 Tax=Taibaiella sp. KBW10 TaxID=2153357 RepID=UPI0013159D38|nr:magnesium/cobalt transporter CorA [Taibaiella sp. KBW10]
MKIFNFLEKYNVPQFLLPNHLRQIETYSPDEATEAEPELEAQRKNIYYTVYGFDEISAEIFKTKNVKDCFINYIDIDKVFWINVDGLRKKEVRKLCGHFNVHNLLVNDIVSIGQRAKTDEIDEHFFCLLPMLTYNEELGIVEKEQLSILLGKNYVISFQTEHDKDPFNAIRQKLKNKLDAVRKKSADYLCYLLIDAVVDDYFEVLESLAKRLEALEKKAITSRSNNNILVEISNLRNEIMVMRRALTPVRDLVYAFWKTNSPLIDIANARFFKDIFDHILLAIEYNESYRDMTINLQDLYMNQVNTKMNEVMKILTVVTVLLAPATVIGGIFGMNFERIPMLHNQFGFYMSIVFMLLVSGGMLFYFKKKDWF